MRFGINTFLFACPFTNQSVEWFPQFKQWGFDTVEISVEDLSHIDPAFIKDHLAEHGLVCGSVTPCLGPDKDLRGTRDQQRAGIDFMKGVIDVMELLDAATLCGVVYSTVGRCEAVPPNERKQQWTTVIENLRAVSEYAGERGRIIALEAINRFETDFINTCEQGLEMIKDVGSSALKLHLDTFHMNIEQKDQAAAIRKAGQQLGHFHACGCDRGTPGGDHIAWPSIAAALKDIRYDGDIVIESFTPDVQAIARAASIWRQIEPTREEIASKGVQQWNSRVNGVLDTKHYDDELHRSWLFRTVGYGSSRQFWCDFISALRMIGYDHALSIEHEDSLMTAQEGLEKAIRFLQGIVLNDPKGNITWA